MLAPAAMVHAQSAADQAIKTLPQQLKDNSENRVVTKSNTASNNAMNKLDSAGNKALKGVTGIFKKKKKKKPAGDSTVVHPADSTALPKTSSFITRPPFIIGLPQPVEYGVFNKTCQS
jgi:hypothetical protein